MKNTQQDISAALGSERCDYLGLPEDPRTSLAFPSKWNYCQHARPAESVRQEYQRIYCQTARHTGCPVFQSEKPMPLPAEIRGSKAIRGGWNRWTVRMLAWVLLGILVVGIALMAGNGRLSGALSLHTLVISTSTRTPSATRQLVMPSEVSTLSIRPIALPELEASSTQPAASPSPSVTSTTAATNPPTPSPSPIGQCGHQFEAAFGSNHHLIIHRARNGDSLNMYADTYHTSVQAIQALNYRLPIPMWKDWVLVIPVGETKVAGLPPFETYEVTEPGIPPEMLAEKLSVDASLLRAYNDFDQSCQLIIGWLVVPREDGTP